MVKRPMKKSTIVLASLFFLTVGIVIGGDLFNKSQPRPISSSDSSKSPLSQRALAEMLASAGIQKVRGLLPSVIFETDKTIAIKNPRPEARVDYLIFPKKDLRNIGQISEEDAPYLSDAYLVAKYIIDKDHLLRYRMYTNGPGYQKVAYLHFHLISK
jgi:hypothetical protein